MALFVVRGLLLWAAFTFPAPLALAQETAAPTPRRPASASAPAALTPSQAVVAEPQILLTLVDPDEKVTVWGNVRLQFSLVNGSVSSGIGTKALMLSIPPALPLAAPGRTARADGTIDLMPLALELRVPGERRDFAPVELVAKALKDLSWWQFFSLLTYRPRKEVFFATFEYQGLADKKPGTRTTRLIVNTAAHPLGMYAGAAIGSLLSALFLFFYNIARLPTPPVGGAQAGAAAQAQPAPETHPALQLLLRFIRGVIATAIALFFVFQTTSELSLPVNVSVQDFYGGVLLGLFGDKIADIVIKKITGS